MIDYFVLEFNFIKRISQLNMTKKLFLVKVLENPFTQNMPVFWVKMDITYSKVSAQSHSFYPEKFKKKQKHLSVFKPRYM